MTIAVAKMRKFGQEYASQIVKNAKSLGEGLYEMGFNVLCDHKGFTESHEVLLCVTQLGMDGRVAAKRLASANIIVNRIPLPGDKVGECSGLRLGTSELTRVGMDESDMIYIAQLFRDCLINNTDPKIIRTKVMEFKKQYMTIHYSFDNGESAY